MIIIKTLLMAIGIVILFSILLTIYDVLLTQWYSVRFKNSLIKEIKKELKEYNNKNK